MILRILVTVFSLFLAQTAYCGVDLNACVDTAVELEAALVTAISNGSTVDTIKIQTGTYKSAANPFGAGGAFASGDSITVEGGWTSTMVVPCQTQSTDPSLTVIDGEGLRGGMQLWHQGAGSITVRNLTFQNGLSNDRGGGLNMPASTGNTADVLVERCIFRNNSAPYFGAGLVASSGGGTVTVRNNLFVGNTSPGGNALLEGAALQVFGNNSFTYVVNNTVTGNISSKAGASNAAFAKAGNNTVTLTNNIFWNNTSGTQSDLYGPDLLLIGNDIQVISGTPAGGSSGNISVDPKFFGANDFRLLSWSPLIDIGTNSPLGGLTSLDLDGLARVQSGTVDLGAYEYSFLFRNGFE